MQFFGPRSLALLAVFAFACSSSSSSSIGTPPPDANPDGCPASAPDVGASCTLPQGTSCRYDATCYTDFYICNERAWMMETLTHSDVCQTADDGGHDG